ncbi:MAG: hypothetical protein V1837_00280 [Candidatus Woesearchaeota archaeon]
MAKGYAGKFAKIVLGLILILVGIWTYLPPLNWWTFLWDIVKGGLGLIIAVIGLIFILMGWSD